LEDLIGGPISSVDKYAHTVNVNTKPKTIKKTSTE
jgi:hypothetical protein